MRVAVAAEAFSAAIWCPGDLKSSVVSYNHAPRHADRSCDCSRSHSAVRNFGVRVMATKNKTNKSVKKRVKVTGTGKLKYSKVGRRHLNAHMTGKRKRQLRAAGIIGDRPKVQKKYQIALGVL